MGKRHEVLELMRTTILDVVDEEPYQREIVYPLLQNYFRFEFEQYLNLEGSQIASLGLGPFQIKEIDEQYIPNLHSQFAILWATLTQEIEQGKLTDDLYKDRSKVGFLYFCTLSILEIAKRRGKGALNLAALYRAIVPIFTDKFRGVFCDLSETEKVEAFNRAYGYALHLVNQHGFTVIGE